MANLKVVDMAGKEVGSIELNDAVFAAEVNAAVLHAAVRAFLLNQRQVFQRYCTAVYFPVCLTAVLQRSSFVLEMHAFSSSPAT